MRHSTSQHAIKLTNGQTPRTATSTPTSFSASIPARQQSRCRGTHAWHKQTHQHSRPHAQNSKARRHASPAFRFGQSVNNVFCILPRIASGHRRCWPGVSAQDTCPGYTGCVDEPPRAAPFKSEPSCRPIPQRTSSRSPSMDGVQ